jgi:hypothetical protein
MNDEVRSRLKVQLQMSGFIEGFATGCECAEQRTIRDFTMRLLRYRCGDLAQELQDLVFALPDETVYSLAEAMFDFSSEEDLRNWLQAKMQDRAVWNYARPHSIRVFGYI